MTTPHQDRAVSAEAETPVPLQRMDVIAWWERERARTLAECRARAGTVTQIALEMIDAVPDRDLVIRRRRALRPVQNQIDAELAAANQALAASLQMGLAATVTCREGADGPNNSLGKTAARAAGGMATTGGLALSATSLTTTSSTMLFVIPVVTFSWPVFLLAGTAAALLATVSGTALVRAGRTRRQRCRDHVQERITAALLAEGGRAVSSWSHFRQEIDRARDALLAGLA